MTSFKDVTSLDVSNEERGKIEMYAVDIMGCMGQLNLSLVHGAYALGCPEFAWSYSLLHSSLTPS